MRFVDLDSAIQAGGLRLVLLKGAPSPWSQAAKAIFEIKGLPVSALWKTPGDQAIQAWTGVANAPIVMYGDEPARAHWSDILDLAERLAPTPALVPQALEQRLLMFGLSHEIIGQAGLVWNMRLALIDLSITSEGARGYSLPIARYLGERYGYTPGCGTAAVARVEEILQVLAARLERGGPYYFGEQLSALDIYSAAAMDTLSPLAAEACPMHPRTRAALEARRDAAPNPPPANLLAHRDLMHRLHMPLPMLC